MKYNKVLPIPESNSEKIGSMQSSGVESLNYHIPKTSGSMPTAGHQINNQEHKIKKRVLSNRKWARTIPEDRNWAWRSMS